MGTLFEQPVRNPMSITESLLDGYLDFIKETAERHGVTRPHVLKALEVLEISRRNDLMVHNGDAWDEQIGGIGELLRELNGILESLTQEYQHIQEFMRHEKS